MDLKINRPTGIKSLFRTNISLLKMCILVICLISFAIQIAVASVSDDRIKEVLDEVTFDLMRQNPNIPITKDMVQKELQKRINQEQIVMEEDHKKLKLAKDKSRHQLKAIMDKIIKNKNTEYIEVIIIKRYGVTQEEAKAIILSHDERAYLVLQELIMNKGK